MKYAVPTGSARITLLIALAARYTGGPASDWDGLDGLDTHPAFQISGRFGYSFGKTRIYTYGKQKSLITIFVQAIHREHKAAPSSSRGSTILRRRPHVREQYCSIILDPIEDHEWWGKKR